MLLRFVLRRFYTPSIRFVGKRKGSAIEKSASESTSNDDMPVIMSQLKRGIAQEEIEIINSGGELNMDWMKVQPLN